MSDSLVSEMDRVVDKADELMETTVSAMGEYGIEVPKKTYLAMGSEEMVAHDNCSQLTISVANSRHGLPSPDTPTAMRVNTCRTGYIVDFVIQIVRCTPTSGSNAGSVRSEAMKPKVSVDDIDSKARERMRDVMFMHKLAQIIESNLEQLGSTKNYIVNVGPDMGAAQAISLIIPVSV